MNNIAAIIFFLALIHTFSTKYFEGLAHRYPKHEGLFHLLGEVEVVFGFWAFILIGVMAFYSGGTQAVDYLESRQYTEPLFVFVIMVVAASRPIIEFAKQLVIKTARLIPIHQTLAQTWVALSIVPLLGSLITEPAAMTLAALILAPLIFRKEIPEWIKYAAIGVLFVNISIGGTLTSYAAPPVLMIAANWQWDSWYMLTHFGWRTMIAVFINASLITYFLNKKINQSDLILAKDDMNIESEHPVPLSVSLLHVMFLAGVVVFAHHPIIFFGVFLMFLGFTTAYARFQSPMILKEGLLVGFFLAGLVVLGGLQQWWLQPIVEGLEPLALFFGAAGLTAITDNAALTYLGSLIQGMSSESKYMLVAGAVAGGGLTVIANAPNPAGATLLKRGFADDSIGAPGLFLGALPPTFIAMFFLLF
jgi:Na+/H+ antiporter NhaD/arsenite permease-like protein